MLHVDSPLELEAHVGRDLGASAWRLIDQPTIDAFANLTGDTHWLHTDPVRAAKEGPFGGTVAHGFMTLALLTSMMGQVLDIGGASHFVNYGLDRVRFTGVVRAGDKVRLRQTLQSASAIKGGVRLTMTCTMEVEGSERPAFVADFIFLAFV
jgi:acyl dehydratase